MVLSARRLGAIVAFAAALASRAAATDCTKTELTETESAYMDYGSTLDTDCSPDSCASACVASMSELADHLPDCEYEDGVNYYDGLLEAVAMCEAADEASASGSDSVFSDSSAALASGSESASGEECSASEISDTEAIALEFNDALGEDCVDPCSSACITDMTDMGAQLPDCIYSDGVNYYEAVAMSIEVCDSSYSGSGSESSDTDACSASESSDTTAYLSQYDSQYTRSCSTDECSSACLAVLNDLADALPDCVDTDGYNYYDGVQYIIESCESESSSASDSESSASSDSNSGSPTTSSRITDASASGSNAASACASVTAVATLSAAAALAAVSLVL